MGSLRSAVVYLGQHQNIYWVAFAFLVVTFVVVWRVTESVTGHIFLAIRENERRLDVLGVRPFKYKLIAFVLSSLIAAGGGVVYVLVIGTAVPSAVASTTVTTSILIMVVLGGAGTRWGAIVGAMVYEYLQQYLVKVSGEPSFISLPAVLRVPLPVSASKTSTRNLSIRRQCCSCGSRRTIRCSTATNVLHG